MGGKNRNEIEKRGWKLHRSLGAGGQGETLLASRLDEQDQACFFALKRLKNSERLPRFRREVQALQAIAHPNVIRIVEEALDAPQPFFVMEYCSRGHLGQLPLADLSLDGKLSLFAQILGAVASAHRARLIHRDLKPANILVRDDGSIAVADFGLCLDLSSLGGERHTELTEAAGPRCYIAPELEGGLLEDPTLAVDCYSLGKVLYFLFGQRCVPRENHRALQFDLLAGPECPRELHFVYDLLDRSIVEDPSRRFEDASVFSEAFDTARRKVEMRAHVLDLRVPQHCVYCATGTYQIQVPPNSRTSRQELGAAFAFFGSNHFDQKPWMVLVCDSCGNAQIFRTDLASKNEWKRE